MNMYRIADLNVAYTPQSDYVAAILAPYQTSATEPHLIVYLSPSALEAEAAHLKNAERGLLEAAALLRALSTQLPSMDRLVLHAATVVYRQNAFAVIAPSGTGKTTLAQTWQRHRPQDTVILNGDRVLLHVTADGVTAFGSPFRGTEGLGENTHAPLKGLFVLTRDRVARCEPISPTEALPHLLRAIAFPSAEQERAAVLSLLETLATSIPLYRLHAPLSTAAVDAAVAQLEETP